jgi:hypothetical protein
MAFLYMSRYRRITAQVRLTPRLDEMLRNAPTQDTRLVIAEAIVEHHYSLSDVVCFEASKIDSCDNEYLLRYFLLDRPARLQIEAALKRETDYIHVCFASDLAEEDFEISGELEESRLARQDASGSTAPAVVAFYRSYVAKRTTVPI